MNAVSRAERARRLQGSEPTLAFTLDGRPVQARAGETIIEVAQRVGVEIPHLCWTPGLDPAGNCRACVVEVKGERVLAASCCRRASAGMEVSTASERARASQRLVLELLQSDLPRWRTSATTKSTPGPPDSASAGRALPRARRSRPTTATRRSR